MAQQATWPSLLLPYNTCDIQSEGLPELSSCKVDGMSVALSDLSRGNQAMLAKDDVDTTLAILDAFSNGSNN